MKYFLPQYVLPLLLAFTVAVVTWTWTIATDVSALQIKTSQVGENVQTTQQIRIDLAVIQAQLVAMQLAQKEAIETLRREIRMVGK